jgi:hypothetical protein
MVALRCEEPNIHAYDLSRIPCAYLNKCISYSAYPQLVQTLSELFDGGGAAEFLMAWNRRIAQSALFFDLMRGAGT